MVCYCCIHGCNNNTNSAKKDFRVISFHSFPSNPALRLKWLKAIGRPNWIPPTYARVCSIHFNDDQINQDGFRSRLKEDAWPVKDLPLHSNFEASHVEVCRICLATDTTMFSLEDELLKICMNSIFAFKERYNMEGFPQFICLECKVILLKCQNLIQKSMTAQATMLDIFSDNGEITKSLVLEIDREKLKLKSSINTYCVTPTHVLEYIYNEDIGSSYLKERYTLGSNEEYQLETDNSTENQYRNDNENQCEKDYRNECNSIIDTVNVEIQTSPYTDEGSADETDGNCTVKQIDFTGIEGTPNITVEYFNQHNTYEGSSDEEESRLQIVIDNADMPTESTSQDTGVTNTVPKTRGYDGLTARELDMQKYFTIVKLSLEEQIMDWNYNADDPQWKSFNSGTSYQCEICLKQFATRNTYNSHMIRHNPSRGSAECPVCRHRFKSDALARAHATRAHSKRFLCKSCPKVFSNVSVATKHSRWHSGYVYRCGRCDFTSAHESALGEHARRRHAESLACACAQCGRTFVSARGLALHATSAHSGVPNSDSCDLYKCEECDINFNSEGARRVHILTSIHHQKKRSLTSTTAVDASLKTTCNKCGLYFPTLGELRSHKQKDHPRPAKKKTSWSLPGDSYPMQCEHCAAVVGGRREHWAHVRRAHPRLRASYRAVVTAVCAACGKGFQNSTKLRIHELRHGSPTLACGACARAFHDKYALARHARSHAPERPHRCAACPRAFKLRAHLRRHARVHSDATPYECNICGKKFKHSTSVSLHVRTAHMRLPPPPRARRPAPAPAPASAPAPAPAPERRFPAT